MGDAMYNYPGQYIAHFGTIGMHWGIRKYQNKDGSLTPLGRDHYELMRQKAVSGDKIAAKSKDSTEKEKAKLGIKSVDENTDIIPKGTVFTRITSGDDTLDNDRKYVSLLKDDTREYESLWDFLPLEDPSSAKTVKYEATGEVKVATYKKTRKELSSFIGEDKVDKYVSDIEYLYGKKKAKQILKTYGDTKLSDLIVDHATSDELKYNSNKTFTKKEQKQNAWLQNYLDIGNKVVDKASDRVIIGENRQSKFYDHMKKLGYDAFVDVFDAAGGQFKYPLVLLNPKDHVSVTKETKMFDDDD